MKKLSSSILLTSATLIGSSAFADDTSTSTDNVQQIVVTAQKRAQSTVDVPESMTVVSGATLEQQQATSFSDYLKDVPGLQLDQSSQGAGRLIMRGLNTGGVSSTVAIYMDESPFGSSSGLVNGGVLAADFDTFDLSRIEVLRGPQGALYGASSLGGLLKFVTNAPDLDKVIMKASVGVSSVEGGGVGYTTNLLVNTPISDTLAFRASGSYHEDPGWIDSIGTAGSDVQSGINDAHNYSERASLLYKPSKNFSARFSVSLQNIDTDAPSVVESDPVTLATLYGRETQSQFVPQFTDVDYHVFNGTINWDLGFANLTSSTSYSTQKQTEREDATYNLSALVQTYFGAANQLYLGQNTNLNKFTQELRLTSEKSGMFDWIIGAFYTDEDGALLQGYVPVVPNTLTPITSLPNLAQVGLSSVYKEIAGFGNATAHLSDRYDIDFGARYSQNRQYADQLSSGALAGGTTEDIANSSGNDFTYSIAPKMKFGDLTSVYARVATGYRPGGPNVLPPSAPAGTPTTYQSDTVTSYEVGVKSRTGDGMYSIDLAAFHIDWKDIQLLAVVNGFGVNTNGAGATSDGLEFTATVRPMRGLSLSVNGAYTDARLDGSTDPIVGGVKGDQLPFSPRLSLGFNGDYSWTVGDNTAAFLGASLRHLSTQSGDFDPVYRAAYGEQRQIPAYSVADVRGGLVFRKWTVEGYVKNLTNSEGKTSTSAVTANGMNIYPNGAIATGVITPRTIGVALTTEF